MKKKELLQQVIRIAEEAGQAILEIYDQGPRPPIDLKKDRTPITEADRLAHEIIQEQLRQMTPHIPLISEEGEIPAYRERKRWRSFWLVDPLDGTKEFLRRSGFFTVNIALIEKKEPVLGVVHAPALRVTYHALKGEGSFKEETGKRRHRIFAHHPKPGQKVVVLMSRDHDRAGWENQWGTLLIRRRVILGSSLKFCFLAEGKAHLYPRFGPTMEWDVAAGDCIWRYASPARANESPFHYNKRDLKNPAFILGFLREVLRLETCP